MESLLTILTQHTGEILGFLLFITTLTLIGVLVLARRAAKLQAKWAALLRGSAGENLEDILKRHLDENSLILNELNRLGTRATDLERLSLSAKRHVGLVRYDAFEDVSGSQSFALAVYDEEGNGAVLNSIIGRADCRVYCKPLVRGTSERTLSQEEQRAIREARSDAPKAIVSP